jgi:wyosine [tRNA(Phe)-imidazoG37] synthetase (radical SAM superfamily)
VKEALRLKLIEMGKASELPDVITFAGNGEPTMHKDFASIVTDTIELRNRYAPAARIAVLSNSTMLFKPSVVEALKKIDDNILKLDSAFQSTVSIMNCPVGSFSIEKVVEQLSMFKGELIIQTMFLRGEFKEQKFDNTTDDEVSAWIELLRIIQPQKVMIYTIVRDTPLQALETVDVKELELIAKRVLNSTGIEVEVSA